MRLYDALVIGLPWTPLALLFARWQRRTPDQKAVDALARRDRRRWNPGGAFGSTVEFVQFCRRGSLASSGSCPTRWFDWPRKMGPPAKRGEQRTGHSGKPDAFLDLVESMSPGPYLELFARRERPGWTAWGNEMETTDA